MVRASAVVRCNSLLRGHSGIRLGVVQHLAELISTGYTPLIPLRGSISASGDLSPLSYFGGLLEGSSAIKVRRRKSHGHVEVATAADALADLGISPTSFEPKEGLAIMNGTSVSTAHASLVLHDCHKLAMLCQLLTAATVEALKGNINNFHPFVSKVRPHDGSTEVARNIASFLHDSKLCERSNEVALHGLAQDRYSLRTAAQWIGPQLEDLALADHQVSSELNCTTDNPLIDVRLGTMHHGGNFQATSITSAMEKARSACVMMGRLHMAQSGELVNPDMNRGLPPNLCADSPSLSFTCKGLDINMTAYFSELAFYANSVGSHVQTAELGNQSVNSLALISARMTGKATKLLSMMVASHIFMVCQALDLRAREEEFFLKAEPLLRSKLQARLALILPNHKLGGALDHLWTTVYHHWQESNRLDADVRSKTTAARCIGPLTEYLRLNDADLSLTMHAMQEWHPEMASTLLTTWNSNNERFFTKQCTESYLSSSTLPMYNFVRKTLSIPFHRGVEVHPATKLGELSNLATTIGGQVSVIYDAIISGRIVQDIIGSVAIVENDGF